jgi:tryptophanyl-tRNA synthetase
MSSSVEYDRTNRPAVANLIDVHASFSGKSPAEIVVDAQNMSTHAYKLQIANEYNAYFTPIRIKYEQLMRADNDTIDKILAAGAQRANHMANMHMLEIRALFGL